VTFLVSLCTWYEWLVVHIYASIFAINHNLKFSYPLKTSFSEINHSLTLPIHFRCHQPKLINRLSRPSIQISLAEANNKNGSLQVAQFGSENWFAAGCPIRQRKQFHCWRHNFGSECYFAIANMFLVANANSLQTTQFQQRVINSLQTI